MHFNFSTQTVKSIDSIKTVLKPVDLPIFGKNAAGPKKNTGSINFSSPVFAVLCKLATLRVAARFPDSTPHYRPDRQISSS